MEFIPAAERYNVMSSIDRGVVRQALDRVVYRNASGVKAFTTAEERPAGRHFMRGFHIAKSKPVKNFPYPR